MILNSYYFDTDNRRIYLEDCINFVCFYRVGSELVTSTVEFFESKYRLIK